MGHSTAAASSGNQGPAWGTGLRSALSVPPLSLSDNPLGISVRWGVTMLTVSAETGLRGTWSSEGSSLDTLGLCPRSPASSRYACAHGGYMGEGQERGQVGNSSS